MFNSDITKENTQKLLFLIQNSVVKNEKKSHRLYVSYSLRAGDKVKKKCTLISSESRKRLTRNKNKREQSRTGGDVTRYVP